ncbi:MAG TPA: helicase-related protein, partial [Candidatus Kapabacteria bacterium]|nr:helicase-related protein [Candidatus Kapabacteria bacterium]
VIFVSATPGDYELEKCGGVVVEQVIRPTGLLDPRIEVRPTKNQIDDLTGEIRKRVANGNRVLVTTLTKRMAEDLAEFLNNIDIKVDYIHSDIDALNRVDIIRRLRLGETDVLIGVNLLREGLDLPEVSLVAVLDADKEGFLRSERSLLQVAGRTARNVDGLVILYADKITNSMQKVINETNRRRKLQEEYNKKHNIIPKTVYKSKDEILSSTSVADISQSRNKQKQEAMLKSQLKAIDPILEMLNHSNRQKIIAQLTEQMKIAASELNFELAARLRDEIELLKKEEAKV